MNRVDRLVAEILYLQSRPLCTAEETAGHFGLSLRTIDALPYFHIIAHMKTTLELPDDLLAEAKATALRSRITLKTLFTRALERELRGRAQDDPHRRFVVDQAGWPVLQRPAGADSMVTERLIGELRESEGV